MMGRWKMIQVTVVCRMKFVIFVPVVNAVVNEAMDLKNHYIIQCFRHHYYVKNACLIKSTASKGKGGNQTKTRKRELSSLLSTSSLVCFAIALRLHGMGCFCRQVIRCQSFIIIVISCDRSHHELEGPGI